MTSNRVDGILLAASVERDVKREKALDIMTPAVAIDRINNYKFTIGTTSTNNEEGAYRAVNYLIDEGHKRILHLAGPEYNPVSIARLNGYVRAFLDHEIDLSIDDIKFGDFSTASGYDRIIDFERINEYTAIFASNDLIAFGAINALNELEIEIPNQISIIGVDNIEYSKLVYPSLTTIDQPSYQLGRESARLLIKHLNGESSEKEIVLDQDLVIRKSVKNIR